MSVVVSLRKTLESKQMRRPEGCIAKASVSFCNLRRLLEVDAPSRCEPLSPPSEFAMICSGSFGCPHEEDRVVFTNNTRAGLQGSGKMVPSNLGSTWHSGAGPLRGHEAVPTTCGHAPMYMASAWKPSQHASVHTVSSRSMHRASGGSQ